LKGSQPPQSQNIFRSALLKEARRDFEREFIARKLKEFEAISPKPPSLSA
jgi:hypothetical protein